MTAFYDFWMLDFRTITWTQISTIGTRPSARWAMGFTSAADGMIYVFGGACLGGKGHFLAPNYHKRVRLAEFDPVPALPGYCNDLFSFDPQARRWTQLNPVGNIPPPVHGMGFLASSNGLLYLFGGEGGGVYAGNIWETQTELYRPGMWQKLVIYENLIFSSNFLLR